MKIRKTVATIALVAAMTVLTQSQTAQADSTNNLATLASTGGALTIGDKTFSGFSFLDTDLSGFNASSIMVTASVDPLDSSVDYLTFSGNMQLAGTSFDTADLLLNYTVTATAGSISMIDQRYTGGDFTGGLIINETATSQGAPTAHSQLTVGDVSDPNNYPNGPFDTGEQDLLPVNPAQNTLYVTKDLAFVILDAAPGTVSEASVSLVQQSFHQVVSTPEPATVSCFLLGFSVLACARCLRKCLTAKSE